MLNISVEMALNFEPPSADHIVGDGFDQVLIISMEMALNHQVLIISMEIGFDQVLIISLEMALNHQVLIISMEMALTKC